MKRILLLLIALVLETSASQLGLATVKQATYLHGSDTDPVIRIIDVPFVTRYADPEWRFTAICKPFIPPTDGSWHKPQDVNLASLYGIKVEGVSVANSQDVNVTIDVTQAKVPEGYPFTLAQVIDSVTTCVKLMYPPKPEDEGKLTIKVLEVTTEK